MTSGECTCSSEESTEINACDNCLSTLPLCDLNDIVQELSSIECKVARLACEQIEKSRNNQNRILSELHQKAKNDKRIEPAGMVKRDETTQSEDDGFEDVYEDVEKGTPRYERREMQNLSAPFTSIPATANKNAPVMGQTVILDTPKECPRQKNSCVYFIVSVIAFVLALAAGYMIRAWLCEARCRFCIPYPFSEKTYPKPF